MDLNIAHIAIGVFAGNICTLAILWCYREFSRPDQENIPGRAIWLFVLILGLAVATLAAQRWAL
jgi:hypothetical protein